MPRTDSDRALAAVQPGRTQPTEARSKARYTRRTPAQLMPGEAQQIAYAISHGQSAHHVAGRHSVSEMLALYCWADIELRRLRADVADAARRAA